MHTIFSDFQFAVRSLCRNLSFTTAAILALALGIGTTTVVFSLVNAALVRQFPYNNDRLVWMWGTFSGGESGSVSPPDYLDYRARNKNFAGLAASAASVPMTLTSAPQQERIQVSLVTGNFFDVFGVSPLLGRGLRLDEERVNAPGVVVLSHHLWQNVYGGRPGIIGETLQINGPGITTPLTIVGVMPADFRLPNNPDVWAPIPFQNETIAGVRSAHWLRPVGRLREGATLGAAQSEMAEIARLLEEEYPNTNGGFGIRLVSFRDGLVGFARNPLLILLGAVVLLLLLACANVANLVLARGTTRKRELATRVALGAGRGRLIRLLISETLVLSLMGGAVGVMLASWTAKLLASSFVEIGSTMQEPGIGALRLSESFLDARVLAFSFILSLVTALIVGLAPALRTAKLSAMDSLRSGPGTVGSGRGQFASKMLVVFEIAISVVLLVGAGLVFRSFLNMVAVDPGFISAGVQTLEITPAASEESTRRVYFTEILDRLQQSPGVKAAAFVSELPLSGYGQEWYFYPEGKPPASAAERSVAGYRRVSADYFQVMAIQVARGRAFSDTDVSAAAKVAIVDQRLVEMYFPGEDPLGKRIVLFTDPENTAAYEIVGISGNVRHYAIFTDAYPTVYTPDVQTAASMTLVARTDRINEIREVLSGVDRRLPVARIKPMDSFITEGLFLPQFGTLLIGIFSSIGLVLAAVGLYGLLAFNTARRTNEIGLRMALGSSKRQVLKLVIADGMKLSGLGLILGIAGAYGFSQVLRGVLFNVPPADSVTFLCVIAGILVVALLASYLPARAAAAIEPIHALRHE